MVVRRGEGEQMNMLTSIKITLPRQQTSLFQAISLNLTSLISTTVNGCPATCALRLAGDHFRVYTAFRQKQLG